MIDMKGKVSYVMRKRSAMIMASLFVLSVMVIPVPSEGLGYTTGSDLGSVDASFLGDNNGDQIGQRITILGDVNGDGYDDFMFGSYTKESGGSGRTLSHLFFGKSSGWSMDTSVSNADASFFGEANFAATTLPVGDVNGDGYDDILCGGESYDSVKGIVYLILGKASGWSKEINLTYAADASFIGEFAGDHAGDYGSIGGNGDVNGDGYDDILIGAVLNDEGGGSAGQSYLIFGKEDGWERNVSLAESDASFIGKVGDYLGGPLTSTGDVNGDGYDDILLGAHAGGGASIGEAYIIFGKASGWAMDTAITDIADASYYGASGGYAGSAGTGLGDVNGDGYDDFIIGAYGHDSSRGAAYLFFGKSSGWALDVDLTNADASFLGESTGDHSCELISHAGDVNGDGYNEIIIGASRARGSAGTTYLVLGKSSGWTANTDLSNADASFFGEIGGDWAGFYNTGGGDVNGDGFDDIAISAFWNDEGNTDAGQAYLIFPDTNSRPSLVGSVKTYSDDSYLEEISSANVNDTIFIELTGTDGNASRKDIATVNVTSSISSPMGFRLRLTESADNSGLYRGNFTIKNRTHDNYRWINASVGETITIFSVKDPSKKAIITMSKNDLEITSADISFSDPEPEEGEIVEITAKVNNIGGISANDVSVKFYDNYGPDPTNWTKYEGNPIFDGSQTGIWVQGSVGGTEVLFDGSTYRMWFGGDYQATTMGRVGYATSTDGILWNEYNGVVLDLGSSGTWDDYSALNPNILYNGTGYQMWYCGFDGNFGGGNSLIGYATSSDGITWNKYVNNPVITRGSPGEWDDFIVMAGAVIYKDGEYKLYYTTDKAQDIGLATSSNGIDWVKHPNNPLMDGNPSHIIHDGKKYLMWYNKNNQMYLADSIDGVSWNNHTMILEKGETGEWDDVEALGPTIIFNETLQRYQMWYSGQTTSAYSHKIGYAESGQIGTLLHESSIDISANQSVNVRYKWNTTDQIGNHTIHVIVDEDGTLDELDETNNAASKDIEVKKFIPGDVSVRSDADYYEPGETVTLYVAHPKGAINVTIEVDDSDVDPFLIVTKMTNGTGNATYGFLLPLDTPLGNYNVTVSTQWRSGTTNFTVASVPPEISSPPDITYELGTANHTITWTGWDKNPTGYSIEGNDSMVIDQGVWHGQNITINVDGLAKGNYSFTLILVDIAQNEVRDSVNVSVYKLAPVFRLFEVNITVDFDPGTNETTLTFDIVIDNTYDEVWSIFLVIQIIDPDNIPMRPDISNVDVAKGLGQPYQYEIPLLEGHATGTYKVQIQLLTGLPRDGGYALDYMDLEIDLG